MKRDSPAAGREPPSLVRLRVSAFAARLSALAPPPGDAALRTLALDYVLLYHRDYEFEVLSAPLAYLELLSDGGEQARRSLRGEAAAVRAAVDEAIGEYCLSLSEVALAVDRLLDERAMTADDLFETVGHVWEAHACNEPVEVFEPREDAVLCRLLADAVG